MQGRPAASLRSDSAPDARNCWTLVMNSEGATGPERGREIACGREPQGERTPSWHRLVRSSTPRWERGAIRSALVLAVRGGTIS